MKTILIASLLLLTAGCRALEQDARPETTTSVVSGDLVQAMQGVSTVSLHSEARWARVEPERVDGIRRITDAALRDAFLSKGYNVLPQGQGDRVIAYAIGTSRDMSDGELLERFGIAPGVSQDAEQPRAGLVLVLLDRHGRRVLWKTSGSANAGPPGASLDTTRERIDRGLQSLLGQLPQRYER